jgi:hypothetical protein
MTFRFEICKYMRIQPKETAQSIPSFTSRMISEKGHKKLASHEKT